MNLKSLIKKGDTLIFQQLKVTCLVAMFGCLADFTGPLVSNIVLGAAYQEIGLVIGGIIGPINMACLLFCTLFCGSTSFLRNKALSEGDEEKAARYLGTMSVIVLIVASLVSLCVYLFKAQYLALFNLTNVNIAYSYTYLEYYTLTPFFTITAYFLYELIFKDGGNKYCTIIIVTQIVTMIAGVIIFPRYYAMVGVAMANTCMEAALTFVGLIYVFTHRSTLKFKFGLNLNEIWEMLKLGLMYCQTSLYSTIYGSVSLIFASRYFGESCMAVVVVLQTVTDVAAIFCGVPYSADNHLAVYLGENNPASIKKLLSASIRIQIALCSIVTILTVIFTPKIVENLGVAPDYIDESIWAVRAFALSFIAVGLIQILLDFYSFSEKVFASLCVAFTQYIICGIGVSILLALAIGERGFFLGTALSAPLTIIISYILCSCKYKTKNVFLMDFKNENIVSYDFKLSEESISEYKTKIENELIRRSVDKSSIIKILLSFEEYTMLLLERNNKKVYCECVLFFNDSKLTMLIRDNAKYFDQSIQGDNVTSLRSYVFSRISSNLSNHNYIYAAGSNRNEFEL